MTPEEIAQGIWSRLLDLVYAPLRSEELLWAALPLIIATLFIALYFGRNRGEELGWNTAFGNTAIFLFVAIGLIRTMYYSGGPGSIGNLYSSGLNLAVSAGLIVASVVLMTITYFHLMPRRAAFFLFSAPPINSAAYVTMTIVYGDVPPDLLTAAAGVVLLIIILAAVKIIQVPLRLISVEVEPLARALDPGERFDERPARRRKRVTEPIEEDPE